MHKHWAPHHDHHQWHAARAQWKQYDGRHGGWFYWPAALLFGLLVFGGFHLLLPLLLIGGLLAFVFNGPMRWGPMRWAACSGQADFSAKRKRAGDDWAAWDADEKPKRGSAEDDTTLIV